MTFPGNHKTRIARLLVLGLGWGLSSATFAACDFSLVRKLIDEVIEQDKQKAGEFRSQVKSGYDSLDVLNRMVAPDMRDKVDACRFEAGEYLTKRGFPPGH